MEFNLPNTWKCSLLWKSVQYVDVVDENFKYRFDEWTKKNCGFLNIFDEVTCNFFGSKYPTVNLHFPNVLRVKLELKQYMESRDAFLNSMETRMFTKFEKYWSKFSAIIVIAAILDPRYKLQFAKWAYEKVWDDNYNVELGLLKDRLFAMWESNIPSYAKYSTSAITPQATSGVKKGCHEFFKILFCIFSFTFLCIFLCCTN